MHACPCRRWTIVWYRTWCGCQHFCSPRDRTSILSAWCLGGGWLGRVRSSRSVRRSLSVPWGLGAPSGTLHITRRTMQRLWGIMVFPCTTRDSSNGSGSHSQPGLFSSVVASGSTNSRGTRLLRQLLICSVMWALCRLMRMCWTSTRYRSRRWRPELLTIVSDHVCIRQRRLRRVPFDLGSAAPRYKWKEWGCGVRPWIPYGSIGMTLIAVVCIYCICVG